MRTSKARTGLRARLACHRRWSVYGKQLPSYTRGGSRMRESRPYGSVRGARDETRVPTATPPRLHHASRRRGGRVAARGARAAAQKIPRIGVVLPTTADDVDYQAWLGAFHQGLAQSGWIIGRNVRIDTRWAGNKADDVRRHAAELVALAPDVILAHGATAIRPLLQATRTVPI